MPHVLSCGHCICKVCIKKLFSVELRSIKCPFDNLNLKYENEEMIPKNFSLLDVTKKLEEEKRKRK
jgi:hypothetical protein